jgi:hypothetical protein
LSLYTAAAGMTLTARASAGLKPCPTNRVQG